MVSVNLQEFVISYEKKEAKKSTTEVALGSLVVEDLMLAPDSKHRKLATSISGLPPDNFKLRFNTASLSTSCPNLMRSGRRQSKQMSVASDDLSMSLPENLDAETVFDSLNNPNPGGGGSGGSGLRRRRNNYAPGQDGHSAEKDDDHDAGLLEVPVPPATPPPSQCSSRTSLPILNDEIKKDLQRDENLVYIKVLSVDPRHPDFVGKLNSTHRFVDIDFNTLDIIFNLKSWVMIFDFFGIGSPSTTDTAAAASTASKPKQKHSLKKAKSQDLAEDNGPHVNSEIDVKVKALSVVLNHEAYEVAVATVKTFVSRISLRDGNFAIGGTLGNFLVQDLTPQGKLYRDRFLTMQGQDQVLTFDFFKYGRPDDKLAREFDATLKLRMASIIYVHTQRFYSELLAFFNHFHQHQSVMNRIRIAAMGTEVNEMASRGSRIRLDVEAGSPLLLLPMSSKSTQILVVNLGYLEIANTFKFAGDEGTISSQTLRSALASQLVGNRRRRSGSRSSRSSVKSRSSRHSGVRSPISNASSVHLSRSRRKEPRGRPRGMSSDTFGSTDDNEEDAETADKVKELPNKPHKCLLDVMNVSLRSIDLRTADRLSAFTEVVNAEDIVVESFIVRPQAKKVLKEKCELKLQLERNLDKAFLSSST